MVLLGELYNCQESVMFKDFSFKLGFILLNYINSLNTPDIFYNNIDFRYMYLFTKKNRGYV